jgi:exopolysaccharide biosynthesis polyprenyl glycosylphosphotransferase
VSGASRPSLVAGREPDAPDATATFSLLHRRGAWKDALLRRMLALADLLAALAAAGAIWLVDGEAGGQAAAWTALIAPLWPLVAKLRGLYDLDHVKLHHETAEEVPAVALWAFLCVAGTCLCLALIQEGLITVGGALAMSAAALVVAVAGRGLARWSWRRLVAPERTVVLGGGPVADEVVRKLELTPGHHLELASHSEEALDLDRLRSQLTEARVERVVVALQDLDEETLSHVASICRPLGVKLSVSPPLRAMFGTVVDLSRLAELPLMEFRTWDPSRSTLFLKRLLDLVGSVLALIVLAPLMVIVAAAVRLDSKGPALFRQRRTGQGGREFTMLKFRTMVDGAHEQVGDVVALDALSEPAFKVRQDPRITRVGRLLRRWSLDELPQLLNVARGDMSLVGPRPEETWLVNRYGEAEGFRATMKPGITGPMQVHGRGELSFQERMAVEREYVENYSLSKDLQILLRTASAVARGHGAY